MTASERLREISRLAPATHWKPRDVLFDALPELIAVVEAAERAMGAYPELDLSPALAALDESLTTKGER